MPGEYVFVRYAPIKCQIPFVASSDATVSQSATPHGGRSTAAS